LVLLCLCFPASCPSIPPHLLQVLPGPSYFKAYANAEEEPAYNLLPKMLLLNAVQIDHPPVNARLVELLLQCQVPLEEVWPQSGETALGMAVSYDDAEVRCTCSKRATLERGPIAAFVVVQAGMVFCTR
jgi:hypothetical protein